MKSKKSKKRYVIGVVMALCMGIFFMSGCRGENISEKETYTWPESKLSKMIPKPESKYGKVEYELDDAFGIDIYNVTKKDFENYIEQCKDKGFTVDPLSFEDYYYADSSDGYKLMLDFDEEKETLSIDISKLLDNDEDDDKTANELEDVKESSGAASQDSDETFEPEQEEVSEPEQEEVSEPEQEEGSEKASADGIRPEIKESIDSYEKFFDEYCEFMTKYSESNNDISLLADYTKFTAQYAETMGKFEEMADEDLNDAEVAYYTEVQLRINQKLSEVALTAE